MPSQTERLAQIETEARKLAHSGTYLGFRSIQNCLVASGYAEASKLFKNRWTQTEIDRLCRMSRLKPNSASPLSHSAT
jgi:hypothetical protein